MLPSRVGVVVGAALLLCGASACSSDERDFADGLVTAGAGGGGSSGTAGTGDAGQTNSGGSGGTAGSAPLAGPCASNPCENGGTCTADGDAYTCTCPVGRFTGTNCESNVNECLTEPCQNGAQCEDSFGDYSCRCSAAYTGKNCELARFEALPAALITHDDTPRISPDGSVVVGYVTAAGNYLHAARYSNGQLRDLGTYIGDWSSEAHAASDNGEVIVGFSGRNSTFSSPVPDRTRPVKWLGTNIAELPPPEGALKCEANDVTPDGKIIVGSCDGNIVRWVDGVRTDLMKPAGAAQCWNPNVSADGKVIAGICAPPSQVDSRGVYPFFWTEQGEFTLVPNLTTYPQCAFYDLSADGTVAVGVCGGGSVSAAIKWTQAAGVQRIGSGTVATESASGVSGDGTVFVGNSANVASLWRNNEPVPIKDLLPAAVRDQIPNWDLLNALAVSRDGKTIVGMGYDREPEPNQKYPYIVRLE